MKILLFASAQGNLDLVNTIIDKHPEVLFCVSLGDMCLYSESTKVEYFLRQKFRHQSKSSIEWNKKGLGFNKPIYSIYGALDDPFIPSQELGIKNIFNIWTSQMDLMVHDNLYKTSKIVKSAFISGYFNIAQFKNKNNFRNKMKRQRQSLALCLDDFRMFYKKNIDIIFSYESPLNYPDQGIGCPLTSSTLFDSKASTIFYGHHRKFQVDYVNNQSIIGVPALEEGYFIVDLYSKIATYYTNNKVEKNIAF